MTTYKRASIIGIVVLLVMCLFCMMAINVDATQNNPLKIWYQSKNGMYTVLNVVDEDTGVNYVVIGGELHGDPIGTCITPRLNADGSLYVSD